MIPTRLLLVVLAVAGVLFYVISGSQDNGDESGATRQPSDLPLFAEAGTWSQKAALPTPRSEVTSAVLDGKIYVVAGYEGNGNNSNVVEVYDPATDAWRKLAPLPEARDHAMAAALGGKLYVFGGGGRDGASSTTFVYDPTSDTWSRKAAMPLRRTAGGAGVLGNRIIIAGGTGDSPATTMLYDPAADAWTAGPPLPAPREHLAVVSTGSAVYVIGGRWDNVLKSTNEVLETTSGPWRRLADLPTARGGTSGGVARGRIYVAGGETFGPDRTFPQVEGYDIAADGWSVASNLPTPRHGLAVQGVGDVLYVIGGGPTAGLSVSPRNEALSPSLPGTPAR